MIVTFLTIWTLAAVVGAAVLVLAVHSAATHPVRPTPVGMLGSQVVVRQPDGTLTTIDLAEPARTR